MSSTTQQHSSLSSTTTVPSTTRPTSHVNNDDVVDPTIHDDSPPSSQSSPFSLWDVVFPDNNNSTAQSFTHIEDSEWDIHSYRSKYSDPLHQPSGGATTTTSSSGYKNIEIGNKDRTVQYVNIDNNHNIEGGNGGGSSLLAVPIVYAPSLTDNPKKANKAKKKAAAQSEAGNTDTTSNPTTTAVETTPPPPVVEERTPTSLWVDLDALIGPYNPSSSIRQYDDEGDGKKPPTPPPTLSSTTTTTTISHYERAYTSWLQESVRHVVGGLLWRLCLVYKGGMYMVTDPRLESSSETASEYKARKPDGYVPRVLLYISLSCGLMGGGKLGKGGGVSPTTSHLHPTLPTHPSQVGSRLQILQRREDAVNLGVRLGVREAMGRVTDAYRELHRLGCPWWNIPAANVTGLEPLTPEARESALERAVHDVVQTFEPQVSIIIVPPTSSSSDADNSVASSTLTSIVGTLHHTLRHHTTTTTPVTDDIDTTPPPSCVYSPHTVRERMVVLGGDGGLEWVGVFIHALGAVRDINSPLLDGAVGQRVQLISGCRSWIDSAPPTFNDIMKHNILTVELNMGKRTTDDASIQSPTPSQPTPHPHSPPSTTTHHTLCIWNDIGGMLRRFNSWVDDVEEGVDTTNINSSSMLPVMEAYTYNGYVHHHIGTHSGVLRSLGKLLILGSPTSINPTTFDGDNNHRASSNISDIEGELGRRATQFVQMLTWSRLLDGGGGGKSDTKMPSRSDVDMVVKGLTHRVAASTTTPMSILFILTNIIRRSQEEKAEGVKTDWVMQQLQSLSHSTKKKKKLLQESGNDDTEAQLALSHLKGKYKLSKENYEGRIEAQRSCQQEAVRQVASSTYLIMPYINYVTPVTTYSDVSDTAGVSNIGEKKHTHNQVATNLLTTLVQKACMRRGWKPPQAPPPARGTKEGVLASLPFKIGAFQQLVECLSDMSTYTSTTISAASSSGIQDGDVWQTAYRCFGLLWGGSTTPTTNNNSLSYIPLPMKESHRGHMAPTPPPPQPVCQLSVGPGNTSMTHTEGHNISTYNYSYATTAMAPVRMPQYGGVILSKTRVTGQDGTQKNTNTGSGSSMVVVRGQEAGDDEVGKRHIVRTRRIQNAATFAAQYSKDVIDALLGMSGTALDAVLLRGTCGGKKVINGSSISSVPSHTADIIIQQQSPADEDDNDNGEEDDDDDADTRAADAYRMALNWEGTRPLGPLQALLNQYKIPSSISPNFIQLHVNSDRMSKLFDLCSGISHLGSTVGARRYVHLGEGAVRSRSIMLALSILLHSGRIYEWEAVLVVTVLVDVLWVPLPQPHAQSSSSYPSTFLTLLKLRILTKLLQRVNDEGGAAIDTTTTTPSLSSILNNVLGEVSSTVATIIAMNTVSSGDLLQLPPMPLTTISPFPHTTALMEAIESRACEAVVATTATVVCSGTNAATPSVISSRSPEAAMMLTKCRLRLHQLFSKELQLSSRGGHLFSNALHPLANWYRSLLAWIVCTSR